MESMRINKYTTLKGSENLPELVKESSVNYPAYKSLNEPEKIYNMMCDVFHSNRQTEEICHMLCLDSKLNLTGIFEISRGTVNYSVVQPREVFMKALLCGATGIILTHNHPSGDTEPSQNDKRVTRQIKECGEMLGVTLFDHIIVGDGYYSFNEAEII